MRVMAVSDALDRARELADAATDGPWSLNWEEEEYATVLTNRWTTAPDGSRHHYYGNDVCVLQGVAGPDAAFIAESRTLLAALVTENEALTAEREKWCGAWFATHDKVTELETLVARLTTSLADVTAYASSVWFSEFFYSPFYSPKQVTPEPITTAEALLAEIGETQHGN